MVKGLIQLSLAAAVLTFMGCLNVAPAHADDAQCVSAAKRKNIDCWNKCRGSTSCNNRCDRDFEKASNNCSSTDTPAATIKPGSLGGIKKNGQDGCYFDECDDDLKTKIDRVQKKPDPDAEDAKDTDDTEDEPVRKPKKRTVVAQTTNICQTQFFWCAMNQTGPVNYPCYCYSPLGPATGVTVPQR